MFVVKLSEGTAARRTITLFSPSASTAMTFASGKLISKAGGALAAMAGTVTELADGAYKVVLTAVDVGTLGHLLIALIDGSGETVWGEVNVVAYDPYDAVHLGVTALPNAAAGAAGGLFTCTVANVLTPGSIVSTSFAADAITAAAVAADVTTEIWALTKDGMTMAEHLFGLTAAIVGVRPDPQGDGGGLVHCKNIAGTNTRYTITVDATGVITGTVFSNTGA